MNEIAVYVQSLESINSWRKYTFNSHALPANWQPEDVTLDLEGEPSIVGLTAGEGCGFSKVFHIRNGFEERVRRRIITDSEGNRVPSEEPYKYPAFITGLSTMLTPHWQVSKLSVSEERGGREESYNVSDQNSFYNKQTTWRTSTRDIMVALEILESMFYEATYEACKRLDPRSGVKVYHRLVKRTYKMFVDACHFWGFDAELTHSEPIVEGCKSWYAPHVCITMAGLNLEFEWDFFDYNECLSVHHALEPRSVVPIKEFSNGTYVCLRRDISTLKWHKRIPV